MSGGLLCGMPVDTKGTRCNLDEGHTGECMNVPEKPPEPGNKQKQEIDDLERLFNL